MQFLHPFALTMGKRNWVVYFARNHPKFYARQLNLIILIISPHDLCSDFGQKNPRRSALQKNLSIIPRKSPRRGGGIHNQPPLVCKGGGSGTSSPFRSCKTLLARNPSTSLRPFRRLAALSQCLRIFSSPLIYKKSLAPARFSFHFF